MKHGLLYRARRPGGKRLSTGDGAHMVGRYTANGLTQAKIANTVK
jgi:hypothetical protein